MIATNLKRGMLVAALTILATTASLSPGVATAQQSNDSFFRITPYLWFLGIDGTTAVLGQDTNVEADFGDLLDVLNIALMVNMEWNTGKWFVVVDPLFGSFEMDFETPGQPPIGGKVEADMLIVDLDLGYVVNDTFDIYAGTRYFDNDISVIPNLLPTTFDIGDSWTDFLLGFRIHSNMSENWSFAAKVDGAVAGDSDSAWYLQAVFMRHFGENKHLDLGWRYYDVDYESGSGVTRFKWDMAQSGPVVGFSWEF